MSNLEWLIQLSVACLSLVLILVVVFPAILKIKRALRNQSVRAFDLVQTISIRSIEATNRFTRVEKSNGVTTTSIISTYDIPDEVYEYISPKKDRQRFCFVYNDDSEPAYIHNIQDDCSITIRKHSMRIKDFELGTIRPNETYLLMLDKEFENLELAMGRPVRHDHYMLIIQIIIECLNRKSSDKPAKNSLLGYTRLAEENRHTSLEDQIDRLEQRNDEWRAKLRQHHRD